MPMFHGMGIMQTAWTVRDHLTLMQNLALTLLPIKGYVWYRLVCIPASFTGYYPGTG